MQQTRSYEQRMSTRHTHQTILITISQQRPVMDPKEP